MGSRGNQDGMASPTERVAARESTEHVRDLVARGQQGDRDALEELYLIHFDRIYSYLHVSVGNRHDAEDLTTQTFLKMLEKIGSFRWQSAPFSAWLFRIAHNLAMDHFRALTRAEATGSGKEHVGMAQIADARLDALAAKVGARKITPAAVRVVDVPGTGPQLLGNLRQVDALLVVLDGFSGTRVPDDDLETLKLELLVADRDHVEKRLERVAKQAKSGDTKVRAEAAELEKLLAHLDAGNPLSEWDGELSSELDPLTTKPLISIVNGPDT